MHSIIAGNLELGVTEVPTYIRQMSNGYYALCSESEAQGVAFEGRPYQLADRPAMTGELEAVRLVKIDGGARLRAQESLSSIAFVALAESGSLDDVTAGEHADVFAEWETGVFYEVGNYRRYNGKLYRCITQHTSQADWTPDAAVSLWTAAADPAEEWPAWSRPVGAHDAYNKGDKVTYDGKHWTSNCDANVWTPGEYGWDAA